MTAHIAARAAFRMQVSSISGSSSDEEDDAAGQQGGARQRGGAPQDHFIASGVRLTSQCGYHIVSFKVRHSAAAHRLVQGLQGAAHSS